jgi:hypothetical protein
MVSWLESIFFLKKYIVFGLSWSHDSSQYFFKKNISSWIFLSQIIFLSVVQVVFGLIKSIGSYQFNFDFFIFIWNFNSVIQVNLSIWIEIIIQVYRPMIRPNHALLISLVQASSLFLWFFFHDDIIDYFIHNCVVT